MAKAAQMSVVHALSVCDIVAQCFQEGKYAIIKVLKSGVELNKLDILSDDIGDIIEENDSFHELLLRCQKVSKMSMSEVHEKVWSRRMGRKPGTKAPELRSSNLRRRHSKRM
jgi:hypothetical protein